MKNQHYIQVCGFDCWVEDYWKLLNKKWRHFCFTYSGFDCKTYIDGVLRYETR